MTDGDLTFTEIVLTRNVIEHLISEKCENYSQSGEINHFEMSALHGIAGKLTQQYEEKKGPTG